MCLKVMLTSLFLSKRTKVRGKRQCTTLTLINFFARFSKKRRPPEELNLYLSEFIIAARTKGEEYEPSSLRRILSRVDRFLTRHEYGKRLFIDPEFTKLQDALKAKQKQLKKQGCGNKKKTQLPLFQTRKLIFSLKKQV